MTRVHSTATLSASNQYQQDLTVEGTMCDLREVGEGVLIESIRLTGLGVDACACASVVSCSEQLFSGVWHCHSAYKDLKKKVSVAQDCFIYQASQFEVHVLYIPVFSLLSNKCIHSCVWLRLSHNSYGLNCISWKRRIWSKAENLINNNIRTVTRN